jgi:hypothetical protein
LRSFKPRSASWRKERGISLDNFDAAGVKPGVLDDLENGRLDGES